MRLLYITRVRDDYKGRYVNPIVLQKLCTVSFQCFVFQTLNLFTIRVLDGKSEGNKSAYLNLFSTLFLTSASVTSSRWFVSLRLQPSFCLDNLEFYP